LPDHDHGCYTLLAILQKHEHKTKDSHYGEEAKFHGLTAVEEVVEVPTILGPWRDSEQKSREQDEYATSQETDLRTPVHQRSARGGSLFQSLSQSQTDYGFLDFQDASPEDLKRVAQYLIVIVAQRPCT
jgi:hypothetical protein